MKQLVLQPYNVPAKAAHEVVVMPQFGDVLDENGEVVIPSTEAEDWTVIDNVPHSVPLIQIFGQFNLLKRRDATCKLIRSSFGKTSNREAFTRKVYVAAENCQQELYQGAFRDWEGQTDIFEQKAQDLIRSAVGADIMTNKWFGKESRAADAKYSLNKVNGVWYYINQAIASNLIPVAQTVDLGAQGTEITEQDAYDAILAMIDKQDPVLDAIDEDQKAIYCDKVLAKKAWRYLVSVGFAPPEAKADAMPGTFMIEDIQIKPRKWKPILEELTNQQHVYAAVLTIKGNFVFVTDSSYGFGPANNGPAMRAWYDEHDDVSKWDFHLKAGFEIIAPQYSVVAYSTGLSTLL